MSVAGVALGDGSISGAGAQPGRSVVVIAGGYAMLCGVITLLGWWLNIPRLTSWDGDGIAMMPNSAFAAASAGVGFLLLVGPRGRMVDRWVAALGLLSGLIGAVTLAQHLTGWDAGIDRLLSQRDWGQRATVTPGRMGPPAAASFAVIGASLILISCGGRARRWAAAGGVLVAAVAFLSLTGYLFGADLLFAVPRLSAIAIQTATSILALGIGLVASVPDREPMKSLREDSATGLVVRRALPLVLLVPLVMGWLRLKGQEAGLYDIAFGTALRTVAEIVLLGGLLWWTAGAIRTHERALRESREAEAGLAGQLRLVTDALPALVSYVDARGRYQFNNLGYEDWFGPGSADLRGKHLREVLGEEAYARLRPHIDAALGGRRVQFEDRIVYRDGGPRWIHADYVPHVGADGNVMGFYALVTDISARRASEEALRESEARFRRMADTAPAMLWVTDRDNLCTFLSRAWFEYTGQNEREGLGTGWTRAVHPDDAEAAARVFVAAAERGESFSLDYRLRRADGEYRWAIDAGRPRLGPRGEFQGFIGCVIDVHERKQVEEQARATAVALERSHRELERFVGIASHDLKEPLRGIATLAGFVIEDEAGLSEQTRTRLVRMEQLCTRLTRMVDGLLDYARSGGERRSEPCDLERIARAAIDKLEERLRTEGVEVLVAGPLPTIAGDAMLLERMFANLIANGVKHNRSDQKRIEIGADGGEVYISDNGVGIDPRHHELVFDLFRKAPLASETDGVGLGLSLVRNIVWSHGGQIRLESSDGGGTRVWLSFPAAGAALPGVTVVNGPATVRAGAEARAAAETM